MHRGGQLSRLLGAMLKGNADYVSTAVTRGSVSHIGPVKAPYSFLP